MKFDPADMHRPQMSEKVVDIGDLRVRRQQSISPGQCDHLRMSYETKGCTISCDDCGLQLNPFAAFTLVVDRFGSRTEQLDRRAAELREIAEKQITLAAAQRVEKAWRSRSMVPICPHCRAPITQRDGFGSSLVAAKESA